MYILDNYQILIQCVKAINTDNILTESAEVQAAVERLYQYWGGYWFSNQTPQRFSVFGHMTKTNNDVESWKVGTAGLIGGATDTGKILGILSVRILAVMFVLF